MKLDLECQRIITCDFSSRGDHIVSFVEYNGQSTLSRLESITLNNSIYKLTYASRCWGDVLVSRLSDKIYMITYPVDVAMII